VKGWDRDEVRLRVKVTAMARSAEEARAIAQQVKVETEGGVRVTGPENRSRDHQWSASIRLDVPRGSEVDLQADNGGIHIEDFSGRAKFNTVNGGIHLDRVGGHLAGRTTNGGVHVNLSGSEWEGEGLDVTSVNGGLHSDIPATSHRRRGHSGARIETDLGRGGPLLRLTTTNGGLHISQD
jgi:hypothetical protein